MNYTVKDEYALFEREPSLIKFRERALSKPNGAQMYDNYMNLRVDVKNTQDALDKMDLNSNSYKMFQDALIKKNAYLGIMQRDLAEPLTNLEKFVNAKSMVTDNWWDKTVDVVRGFLSSPHDEDTEQKQPSSQKPSLWDVFWK